MPILIMIKCCSVDLGVDNLITIVSENEQPIIYNGKQIWNISLNILYYIENKLKINFMKLC